MASRSASVLSVDRRLQSRLRAEIRPGDFQGLTQKLDYIAQLVGPDHVGLGLDYVFDVQEMQDFFVQQRHTYPDDPSYRCEPRFVEPERIPEIAASLRRLGYEAAEVNGILGGNWLRVAQAVWK